MSRSKVAIYAYVDETGNTGRNIFDENQPDFFTAALITRGDIDLTCGARLTRIANSIGQSALHAQEFGVGGLEKISPDLLDLFNSMKAHFFVSRVEKAYLLATKLFDSIFDSGENAAVAWEHYNIRPFRLMLAFKVASIVDLEIAKLFWQCLLIPSEKEAYKLLPQVCDRLIQNVSKLPDERSRTIITDGLEWAKAHPESIQILNDRKVAIQGHFPNMVAFTNLLAGLQHYSEMWKRPVARIVHDRQSEFEKTFVQYHDRYSNAPSEPIKWAGETYVMQKVPGSEFLVKSDSSSPGIQIADVALWLYSQFEKGRKLPPSCAELINYILQHAWINDFSFEGVQEAVLEKYGKAFYGEITPEQEAEARKLLEQSEKRRIASMEQYEQDKIPPFMRD